jgi:hypothetical protein
VTHERHPNQVGMCDDKLQVFQVFGRDRRKLHSGIGQVDLLVGSEPVAFWPGVRDFDLQRLLLNLTDDAADFAVIEPYGLADAHLRKNLRKSA